MAKKHTYIIWSLISSNALGHKFTTMSTSNLREKRERRFRILHDRPHVYITMFIDVVTFFMHSVLLRCSRRKSRQLEIRSQLYSQAILGFICVLCRCRFQFTKKDVEYFQAENKLEIYHLQDWLSFSGSIPIDVFANVFKECQYHI